MSTRCQLQVVEEGSDYKERITLYHHNDGYPVYMIPMIYRAWIKANEVYFPLQVGRAEVATEILCLTDRGGFKWEKGHRLHGDIEHYYRLHCWYSKLEETPVWELDVYERNFSILINDFTLDDFKQIERCQQIENLTEKYGLPGRNLQNPTKVVAASTIARELLVESLSEIESQAVYRE